MGQQTSMFYRIIEKIKAMWLVMGCSAALYTAVMPEQRLLFLFCAILISMGVVLVYKVENTPMQRIPWLALPLPWAAGAVLLSVRFLLLKFLHDPAEQITMLYFSSLFALIPVAGLSIALMMDRNIAEKILSFRNIVLLTFMLSAILLADSYLRTLALNNRAHFPVNFFMSVASGSWVVTTSDFSLPMPSLGFMGDVILVPIGYLTAVVGADAAVMMSHILAYIGAVLAAWYAGLKSSDGDRLAAGAAALAVATATVLWCAHLYNAVPRTLSPAFLLLAWGLYRGGKSLWSLLCIILFLCFGIPGAVVTAPLGLYLFFAERRRLSGAMLFIVSVAWFIGGMHLMTILNNGYMPQGSGLSDVISMLLNPLTLLKFIFNPKALVTMLVLLAPLGFLPLARPWLWAVVLPAFYMNYLVSSANDIRYGYAYMAFLPVLVMAAVEGANRMKGWLGERGMVFYLAGAVSAGAVLFNPWSFWNAFNPNEFSPTTREFNLKRVMDSAIPEGAIVSCTFEASNLLAPKHPILYHFPGDDSNIDENISRAIMGDRHFEIPETRDAEYLVIDFGVRTHLRGEREEMARRFIASGDRYGAVAFYDGCLVMKKGESSHLADALSASWDKISGDFISADIVCGALTMKGWRYLTGDQDGTELEIAWAKSSSTSTDDGMLISVENLTWGERYAALHNPFYGLLNTPLPEDKVFLEKIWLPRGIRRFGRFGEVVSFAPVNLKSAFLEKNPPSWRFMPDFRLLGWRIKI